MVQLPANAVPQLVLLLVVSPWIGVALLLARWCRQREAPLRRFALGNTVVTAIVATGLMAVATSRAGDDSASLEPIARQAWMVLVRGGPVESGPQLPPWTMSLVLSVGWDEWNAGPLLWIPWLFCSVLLTMPRSAHVSSGVWIGLLAAEGCLLLQFAAQDAWTFCLAGEAVLWMWWAFLGSWGDTQRRRAAQTLFGWQYAGQLLWLFGLMGLAISGVWTQWETRGERALIRCSWDHLAPLLGDAMILNLSHGGSWQQAAGMVLTALLVGTILRAGLVPAHHAWTSAVEHAALPLCALLIGSCGIIGVYGYLRFVAPLVELGADVSRMLMWLGGGSALLGGCLTCAASNLRRCVAAWWVAVSGSLWIGLGSGMSDQYASVWNALQAAAGTGVVLLLVLHAIEQRSSSDQSIIALGLQHSFPRLTKCCLAITLVSLSLLPLSWGADFTPGWVASAGWFLASWGLIWQLLKVLYGRAIVLLPPGNAQVIDVTSPRDSVDLTGSEGLALILVLGVSWVPGLLGFMRSLP